MPRFRVKSWGALSLAGLLALGIFVQSSQASPSLSGDRVDEIGHNLAHFGLYSMLAFFFSWALCSPSRRHLVLLSVTLAFLFGVSDEFHQSFVAAREASWTDLGIDFVGASCGAMVSAFTTRAMKTPLGR